MHNILLIGLGILVTIGHAYSLDPVYSAQATSDFSPSTFGNNNQNNNNGNINSQTGNNNGYGPNNSNTKNNSNNNGGNFNQPVTLNTNGNNGYSMGNNPQNNTSNNNSGNNNYNNSSNNNNENNNQMRNNQGSNQGNNWNNNQNNGNYNNSQQNAFTENYALKGRQFNATVYRKDRNNQLYKTNLNSNDLQKAIIIFFGDWCPHCSRFLQNFSKNIPALTQAGVKIIFIGVPSVERLQTWRDPTESDYNENLQKLNGFGVQLGNNMELVLLGNSASLQNNAVDSLPTMMAVSNGRECFRGGSDNSIEKAEFNNNDEVNQFLQVFNSFGNNNQLGSSVQLITTSGNNNRNNGMKKRNSNKKTWGVDIAKANMYTDLLNDGCTITCLRKKWTPPTTTTYNYRNQYACPPCPPCPVCPVCPRCAAPITKTAQPIEQSEVVEQAEVVPEGTITQLPPQNDSGTCTTCGCIFKRAFSPKCNVRTNQSKSPRCRKVKCCRRNVRN